MKRKTNGTNTSYRKKIKILEESRKIEKKNLKLENVQNFSSIKRENGLDSYEFCSSCHKLQNCILYVENKRLYLKL